MKIKIKKPTKIELESLNIENWSKWKCEPSKFDWEYNGTETCYVFEGNVIIKTAEEEVEINPGDLVQFPDGLKCHWNVKKEIKKVFTFSTVNFD